MKVVWAVPAELDREQIIFFIAEDNPDAAIAMDDLIGNEAQKLALSPFIGRLGRVPETREWVIHKNYILVYQCDEENDVVYITAVLHTSRQWPPEAIE